MAILSFKKRFAGKVRNGRKRQTIRAFIGKSKAGNLLDGKQHLEFPV